MTVCRIADVKDRGPIESFIFNPLDICFPVATIEVDTNPVAVLGILVQERRLTSYGDLFHSRAYPMHHSGNFEMHFCVRTKIKWIRSMNFHIRMQSSFGLFMHIATHSFINYTLESFVRILFHHISPYFTIFQHHLLLTRWSMLSCLYQMATHAKII
jgi:hypothetical protein